MIAVSRGARAVAAGLCLLGPGDRWFGPDKVRHFVTAALVQSVTYSALRTVRVRHDGALAGATAVTAIVSVGKEVHDRRVKGEFSVKDLAYDAAGAGAATLVLRRTRR